MKNVCEFCGKPSEYYNEMLNCHYCGSCSEKARQLWLEGISRLLEAKKNG